MLNKIVESILKRIANKIKTNREEKELYQMTDLELADIGLSRSGIRFIFDK